MSEIIAGEPAVTLLQLPSREELDREIPNHDQVKRTPAVLKSDPRHQAYEDEQQLDLNVLLALVVGGFDDDLAPNTTFWAAVATGGGVCWALIRELIDVGSCQIMDSDFTYRGLWQLIFRRLTPDAPLSDQLKESISRLFADHDHIGGSHSDSYTDCYAAWLYNHLVSTKMPIKSFAELPLSLYKRGSGLENFDSEDQEFLTKAIEGTAMMLKELHQKIAPRYQW